MRTQQQVASRPGKQGPASLPLGWGKEDLDKSLTLAQNLCTPNPCTYVHIHMCVVNSKKLLHMYMSILKPAQGSPGLR